MVDIAALRARFPLRDVVGHYVRGELKKVGNEWVGLCVNRDHDDKNPSMYINERKGLIHCFACGFNKDLFSFIQYVENLPSFLASAHFLDPSIASDDAKSNGSIPPTFTPRLGSSISPEALERITIAADFDVDLPNTAPAYFGKPIAEWEYRNAEGLLLGIVARYADDENGKKVFHPWTWGSAAGVPPYWAPKSWTKPNPIYGLDRLAVRTSATVLICEGEKAADAAGRLLPKSVAITWPAGASAVLSADWAALRGRKCILWPDNDEPGIKAMQKLAAMISELGGLACETYILDPKGESPAFDAADAEAASWDQERTGLWVASKATRFIPQAIATIPPQQIQAAPLPQPPVVPIAPLSVAPSLSQAPTPKAKPALSIVTREGNIDLAPEPQPVLPLSLSESGLAKEFCDAHHETSRYVWEYGKWLSWNGSRWLLERGRETPYSKVSALVHGIKYRAEAAELTTRDKRKMEARAHIGNILDISQHDRRIIATPALFDADPMLLGTPAGTIDLRTGELRASLKADFLTRQTAVTPKASEHPLFDRVLGAAADGNTELLAYLWRWLGYLLTGDVREEAFLFLYGKPQSGKTTLIEAIASILGSTDDGGYAALCEMDLLAESKMDRGTDRLIKLAGARFAYASETEEGRHWKASLLKLVTGGDRLPGRRLYEESVSFKPTHKLWVFGNFRPHLRTADGGVKRRLHLLEYHGAISDAERDSTLKQRLVAEYPAILHSMIQGCLAWQRDGLKRPAEISSNVDEYMESEDTLGAWLEECTQPSTSARTGSKAAYTQYHAYVEGRGERPATQKRFSMDLRNRGYTIIRSGGSHILGLALKAVPSPRDFDDSPPRDWADR